MVVVFGNMAVSSRADFVDGQPAVEGHNFPVRHVVVNVNCLGLEGYFKGFYFSDDVQTRSEIREAVEYCRTEQCDVDNEVGNLVSYCQSCVKSGKNKCNVWEIAQKVYELNYED